VALLWSYINVTGSAMIKDIVEPMFKLPGPLLSSTRFTKIDLGKVPIKLDNIVVHDIKDVRFDLDLH
jgi:hypothetical protein